MKIAAFLLVFLFYFIPASAEVYKYTDQNGILFFTDNPDDIPEGQRHTIEKVKTDAGLFNRWISLPTAKIALILLLLTVIAFIAHSFFGVLLPRMFMMLLVILLLGTMIYSIYVIGKEGSASWSFDKAAEPYLPSPAPINKAKEVEKKLEEGQKKQEELINSLQD